MARFLFFTLAALALCTFVVASSQDGAHVASLPAHRMVKRARHHHHHDSKKSKSKPKSSKSSSSKSSKSTKLSKSSGKSKSSSSSSGKITGTTPSKAMQALFKKASTQSKCEFQLDTLSGGFKDGGNFKNQHYCGNRKKNPSYIYWYSNMDVDCDGAQNCPGNTDFQSQTMFQSDGKQLDASTVPYVVINQQEAFNPFDFGLEGLASVTVICRGKQFPAIWGDTNGESQIGEAAISLARACFGDSITGDNASPDGVLYVAHTGKAAVPDSLAPAVLSKLSSQLVSNISF